MEGGIKRLAGFRKSVEGLEHQLHDLLELERSEVTPKLGNLEQAELTVLMAYTTASLCFMGLKAEGLNAAKHPVMSELNRVQKYMVKVKKTAEKLRVDRDSRKSKVDVEAAKRIIEHNTEPAVPQ
uniref:Nuclear nucleic acid-binding protein C1D n=1 Tax=Oxyrrhis marina TaxID=2969 RepID=A0A7S3XH91_OXYMA